MNAGFIKIRRGLREHLRSMSANGVKLYLWLHLSATYSGPQKGCVESDYEEIARSLGWAKKTVQRTVAELKPRYIEVRLAANQNEVTAIKILKYDRPDNSSGVDKSVHAKTHGVDIGVDTSVDKAIHRDVRADHFKSKTRKDLPAPKKVVEGIEGRSEQDVWMFLGLDGACLPAAIQRLCADLYQRKNDQNPVDFIGACMDAMTALECRIPRQIAQRARELRSQPIPKRQDRQELESIPWQK